MFHRGCLIAVEIILGMVLFVSPSVLAVKGSAKADDSPATIYKARREKLMKDLGPGSAAIFYSSPVRPRNGDSDYPYRQSDDFYYLTGLNSPDCILLLVPSGFQLIAAEDSSAPVMTKEVLFYRAQSPAETYMNGPGLNDEKLKDLSGLERGCPISDFERQLVSLTASIGVLYVPAFPVDFTGEIAEQTLPLRKLLPGINRRVVIKDPTPLLSAMRYIKSPDEIALLRKAAEISVVAQTQAMMSVEPGMAEYEISALLDYVFARMGAESAAFTSVVGAGSDALILHPDQNRRQMDDGELVLIDAGAEVHNYAADVTRTIPVNGRFSDPQREIYEIVLQAEEEALKSIKPGVKIKAVEKKAMEIITKGLVQIGILKGASDSLLACAAYRPYTIHGIIHTIGLDVHDVQPGSDQFEAGMIVAVEPGLYFHPESKEAVARYASIGVRIEDMVVITKDGIENLTADVPKSVQEIERLMKRRGLGNEPLD